MAEIISFVPLKKLFVSTEFDWNIEDAFLSTGAVFDGWEVSCLVTREKYAFGINLVILFSASSQYESALLVVVKNFELPSKRWWMKLFILKRICYRKRFLEVLGQHRPSHGSESKKQIYRSRGKYSKIYWFLVWCSFFLREKIKRAMHSY